MKTLLWMMVLVACKGGDKKSGRVEENPVETKKTDPACATKTTQLQGWLDELQKEKETEEINFGWQPVVLDRKPSKVTQDADYVLLTPKTVSAWDVSEANHVGDNIGAGADPKKVSDRLAAVFAMKGAKAGDDLLRIDVDVAATWGEVAKLVDAAAQVGYTKVVFAFEATSKVAMPQGVTGPTTDSKVTDEANKRLEEMRQLCPGWGYTPAKAAEAIANCNCKVDPDEVRVQTWKAEMWHQAHTRVGIELAIAKDGNAIEYRAATPWSEAHKAIASMQMSSTLRDEKNPVRLVATK